MSKPLNKRGKSKIKKKTFLVYFVNKNAYLYAATRTHAPFCSLYSSTIELQKPELVIAQTLSESKLILVTARENDKAQTHVGLLKLCGYPNYYKI